MYQISPYWHKAKFYYDNDTPQRPILEKIQKMYSENAPTALIQEEIKKLQKIGSVFMNNTVDCAISTNIIMIATDKVQTLENIVSGDKFKMDNAFETSIVTTVNTKYIKYIAKYGVPEDGIFLEELLAEF